MHNFVVGICLTAGAALFLSGLSAEARRDENQYFIPPPPPTPVLVAPPQPVMLPYSEAYSHFRSPAAEIPLTQPKVLPFTPGNYGPPPQAVRRNPNFTGLCLTTAETKGFGKPRVPYNVGYGPGAAFAAPAINAPAMNTWFDSSLRWYANHTNTSSYYNNQATQEPQLQPSLPAPQRHSGRKSRRAKRVVAYK